MALDRAVALASRLGPSARPKRWAEAADEVRRAVLERGWNREVGAFTGAFGSDHLDASVLLLPLVGFLPAGDPRVVATVDAIRRELEVDGLVHRYRDAGGGVDGLPPGEGAFLACSFWLVEVLALQGRRAEARDLFERLLALRNDVGLLAEEYDPVGRRQLGNFPQALSHLALVTAALALGEGDTPRRSA